MFCKICSEPCAPQFDYCYYHRQEREHRQLNEPRRVADLKFQAEMKHIMSVPICVEGQYEWDFETGGRDGEHS